MVSGRERAVNQMFGLMLSLRNSGLLNHATKPAGNPYLISGWYEADYGGLSFALAQRPPEVLCPYAVSSPMCCALCGRTSCAHFSPCSALPGELFQLC